VDTNTQMSQLRTSLSIFAAGTASAIQDLLSQIPVPPQAVLATGAKWIAQYGFNLSLFRPDLPEALARRPDAPPCEGQDADTG
jgi:hypothetical protein